MYVLVLRQQIYKSNAYIVMSFFFFFQAEDGIRDIGVTGVQTCALPIYEDRMIAYLECRLQSSQEAGDHTIFIAEVEDASVWEGEPLLYFRGEYHKIGPEDRKSVV